MSKTFNIDESMYHQAGTYQFEEGMTWTEWLASSYNTENWYSDSDDGRIFQPSKSGWLYYNFLYVTETETIVENRKYHFGKEIS